MHWNFEVCQNIHWHTGQWYCSFLKEKNTQKFNINNLAINHRLWKHQKHVGVCPVLNQLLKIQTKKTWSVFWNCSEKNYNKKQPNLFYTATLHFLPAMPVQKLKIKKPRQSHALRAEIISSAWLHTRSNIIILQKERAACITVARYNDEANIQLQSYLLNTHTIIHTFIMYRY